MEQIIALRGFLAYALALVTGVVLTLLWPWPTDNIFLEAIQQRNAAVYAAGCWSYRVMLFSTAFLCYTGAFTALYLWWAPSKRASVGGTLPKYAAPNERESLYVVVGEQHHPTRSEPAAKPTWLTVPERGLFTGVAIFGAIGTGKTSCCMRPFAEQIFGYAAADAERRIGGLVLEVKGDFCHQVHDTLIKYGRGEDYIEIGFDSDYRYNPLHNELEPYALAYALASLMAGLFGKGGDPFWSMASTNVVKFIILLHRLVGGYVTLYDVYTCAINPGLLQQKIDAGKRRFVPRGTVTLAAAVYSRNEELFDHELVVDDENVDVVRGPLTDELKEVLEGLDI